MRRWEAGGSSIPFADVVALSRFFDCDLRTFVPDLTPDDLGRRLVGHDEFVIHERREGVSDVQDALDVLTAYVEGRSMARSAGGEDEAGGGAHS